MDYYKGLLFLTTNRPEVIDPAFKSRITIQLDYKALDRDVRREVWESMTDYAGIKVVGGLDGVPDMDLNGRQIRNMVRLTKVLHGGETTNAQIKEVCGFACK
jgi:AAA+ superfamily predicted ATPase